jgi:hypothetical protein
MVGCGPALPFRGGVGGGELTCVLGAVGRRSGGVHAGEEGENSCGGWHFWGWGGFSWELGRNGGKGGRVSCKKRMRKT